MKEIWRMWRMVTFFKRNEYSLALKPDKEKVETLKKAGIDERLATIVIAVSNREELRVSRELFVVKYHKEYYGTTYVEPGDATKLEPDQLEKNLKDVSKIKSILNSCLNEKNGFLDKDEKGIYLTEEGKMFSCIDGLIKKEAEVLGLIWSLAITAILAATGGFAAKNFWEFLVYLVNLIIKH